MYPLYFEFDPINAKASPGRRETSRFGLPLNGIRIYAHFIDQLRGKKRTRVESCLLGQQHVQKCFMAVVDARVAILGRSGNMGIYPGTHMHSGLVRQALLPEEMGRWGVEQTGALNADERGSDECCTKY